MGAKRSVLSVFVLTFITFGIYALVWLVSTKHEMQREGAEIPTSWLLIVPFASIYWTWKWAGGVEQVTHGKMAQGTAFLLLVLAGWVGMLIIQSELNQEIERRQPVALPRARIA